MYWHGATNPVPLAMGAQRFYFIGQDGQLLWCEWPIIGTIGGDKGSLLTNDYIPNIPGSRGSDFLDSKFLSTDETWWGCHWIHANGKLGFIINSSESQTSEFIECSGLWFFNLEIDGTRRPIIVSYRQGEQGVSPHIFYLSLKS